MSLVYVFLLEKSLALQPIGRTLRIDLLLLGVDSCIIFLFWLIKHYLLIVDFVKLEFFLYRGVQFPSSG